MKKDIMSIRVRDKNMRPNEGQVDAINDEYKMLIDQLNALRKQQELLLVEYEEALRLRREQRS